MAREKYVVTSYQKGFEPEQVRIGREVARHWIWPYAYNLKDLLQLHAQPDFDPETRHYCFLGNDMVGYTFSIISAAGDGEPTLASIDFPRVMPGHEDARELLLAKALATLQQKGIARVTGRVTTMCPGDILLAEKAGFTISDWGYKVYYTYEMRWGSLQIPDDAAREIDPETDLEKCAEIAARWYKRPSVWCRSLLAEWHEVGVISHLGVWEEGKLVAACMAAPNTVRPSTAAIYYIYTPDEYRLRSMLAKVVAKCLDYGVDNVIADLIYEHRQYEPVYQQLGFKKVADWARCEKLLS